MLHGPEPGKWPANALTAAHLPAEDADPPTQTSPADGLAALRALDGLVWTAEAMRLAETIVALPDAGGAITVPAGALHRLGSMMSPAPADLRRAARVLVGMGTVLALASGRLGGTGPDRAALVRPLHIVDVPGGLRMVAGAQA